MLPTTAAVCAVNIVRNALYSVEHALQLLTTANMSWLFAAFYQALGSNLLPKHIQLTKSSLAHTLLIQQRHLSFDRNHLIIIAVAF